MTSDEKTIKSLMDRLNIVERENITLKIQVQSLKNIVDHDLQMIEKLQSENRKLAATVTDRVRTEIDDLLKSVGCQ
jgi:hypothetical protein